MASAKGLAAIFSAATPGKRPIPAPPSRLEPQREKRRKKTEKQGKANFAEGGEPRLSRGYVGSQVQGQGQGLIAGSAQSGAVANRSQEAQVELLLAALRRHGHESFRSHQQAICMELMNGRDVFALLPTGRGKSVCYQAPALALEGVAIVVSPLIALIQDQVTSLRAKGLTTQALNSSIPKREQQDIFSDLERKEGKPRTKLLFTTPEMLSASKRLGQALRNLDAKKLVSLIAIDEAHCISSYGHDFRPAYRRLGAVRASVLVNAPCIALTATATEKVVKDIAKVLRFSKQTKLFDESFDRPNISLHVVLSDLIADPQADLIAFLEQNKTKSGIVYALKQTECEELAAGLVRQGLHALAYHGKMSKAARKNNFARWMEGQAPIMCATLAFGMGIDKSDVGYVVHWNVPKNLEACYQELGRAGRDGKAAQHRLYYSLRDASRLHFLVNKEAKEKVAKAQVEHGEDSKKVQKECKVQEQKKQSLDAMIAYCEGQGCRRRALLSHFGQKTLPATAPRGSKCCDCCGDTTVAGLNATHLQSKKMGLLEPNSYHQESSSSAADNDMGMVGASLAGYGREDEDEEDCFNGQDEDALNEEDFSAVDPTLRVESFASEGDWWDELEKLEEQQRVSAAASSTRSAAPVAKAKARAMAKAKSTTAVGGAGAAKKKVSFMSAKELLAANQSSRSSTDGGQGKRFKSSTGRPVAPVMGEQQQKQRRKVPVARTTLEHQDVRTKVLKATPKQVAIQSFFSKSSTKKGASDAASASAIVGGAAGAAAGAAAAARAEAGRAGAAGKSGGTLQVNLLREDDTAGKAIGHSVQHRVRHVEKMLETLSRGAVSEVEGFASTKQFAEKLEGQVFLSACNKAQYLNGIRSCNEKCRDLVRQEQKKT